MMWITNHEDQDLNEDEAGSASRTKKSKGRPGWPNPKRPRTSTSNSKRGGTNEQEEKQFP